MHAPAAPPPRLAPHPARGVAAAFAASLVGIGLARFAYTPLLPALIEAGWFQPGAAAYLGAANLAGYLAGAMFGQRLARRLGTIRTLRANMLLAAISFFACAVPLSFAWYFVWRFAAGMAGGCLMVLAATTVLPLVAPGRRGVASGAIFAGVGIGVAASGSLIPLLLGWGLPVTWSAIGVLALVLTALAWNAWPAPEAVIEPVTAEPEAGAGRKTATLGLAVVLLSVCYGLNAVGLVPHMVFLVDFVARGLDRGMQAGSFIWVLFGVGAIFTPVLAGHIADRIGFRRALRGAFVLQAVAVFLPVLVTTPAALAVSAMIAGGCAPGIVPLVLGRLRELLPGDPVRQRTAWSRATIAFSVGQAGAGYLFSFLFARTHEYRLLFTIAAAALVGALLVELAAGRQSRRTGATPA